MPEFFYNNKLYYNPVEFAMDRIGGTWKMPILWRLKDRVMRFSELKRDIPHITDKMLTSQLGYPGIVLDSEGEPVAGFLFSSENLNEHWGELDAFEGEAYERGRDPSNFSGPFFN